MKIVFATGNSGKLREASEILGGGFELVTPAQFGITEDIPETGSTLRANSLRRLNICMTGADATALQMTRDLKWMHWAELRECIRQDMPVKARISMPIWTKFYTNLMCLKVKQEWPEPLD